MITRASAVLVTALTLLLACPGVLAQAAPEAPASDTAAEAEDADESDDEGDDAPLSLREPVVRGVEIVGADRVDTAGIRAKIYTQVGRPLDRARLTEDVKRVYRMGFFDDVQVAETPHADGGIIVVFGLSERPTVISIEYQMDGDSVDLEDIQKVVDLKPFGILDEAAIRFNLTKIEDLYEEEGHYLVGTRYSLRRSKGNAVGLIIHVEEGEKVEVRHIHILGTDRLDPDEIKDVMQTKEGGFFSFLTSSGEFKKEHFEADLQRIQIFLLSKGFVEAKVEEPRVSLSADKRAMTIAVRLTEGPRYRIGNISLESSDEEWLVPEADLRELIELDDGDVFNWMTMQQDGQRLGDVFRDRGYANATVTNGHRLKADSHELDIVYTIQKGELVYFNRIEVRGNKTTRDKVIRRELKVGEGELYSASKLRRSRARVMSTGFFENVDIVPQPTEDPARMDLFVDIKERNTGTFQIGAGFSSLESFILTAQISKQNFLGRGQTLSAQATISGLRQMFSLSFFEPYFFDSNVTFAFDLFNMKEDFVDFTRLRTGGTLSWGYRFTDYFSASLTYTLEQVEADLRGTNIPLKISQQRGLTSSLTAQLSFDTRDNQLFPTDGNYTTLRLEYAPEWLGTDNEFVRVVGRTRFYFPLFWDMVFKTNLTLGYVTGTGRSAIPIQERFFVGGIFNIRGYERNSIGEELFIADGPDENLRPFDIGGTKELIFNAEVEIPIFLEVGIRGVVFFDAGNAWGDQQDFLEDFDLRTSAGFGIRWQSPVGPLRFEWGFPLKPRKGEDPVVFEFTIGNSF